MNTSFLAIICHFCLSIFHRKTATRDRFSVFSHSLSAENTGKYNLSFFFYCFRPQILHKYSTSCLLTPFYFSNQLKVGFSLTLADLRISTLDFLLPIHCKINFSPLRHIDRQSGIYLIKKPKKELICSYILSEHQL